jgi:serine/threonine protein kinase
MDEVILSEAGSVRISGRKISIPHYAISQVIGRGANGVVFRATHEFLDREDAVKLWLKLKPNDDRDKFKQGIEEVKKAIALRSEYVVPIHNAGSVDDIFYCAMEYLKGPTLHELLDGKLYCDFAQRHALATLFLDAVFKTTRDGIFHGDLHTKNIIVLMDSIRLLDFGTSRFTSKGNLEARHWRVVHSTFKKIVSPFDIDSLYRGIPEYEPNAFAFADDPPAATLPPSMYYFFLAQLPYFIIHNWADEILAGYDRPSVTDKYPHIARMIHPTVSHRLRKIRGSVPVDALEPLLARLGLPEDPERHVGYVLDWGVRENEIVPIKLHYKQYA